ncbi:helix-hairpin-helix domain-containing protein [Natronospora cellulosivora (SeqCode)]
MGKEKLMKSDLQEIPGVGRKIEEYLIEMGYSTLESLKGEDPESLYDMLCDIKGYQVDRCMLYVFRCAVYYAESKEYEPGKLKWWYWKDSD